MFTAGHAVCTGRPGYTKQTAQSGRFQHRRLTFGNRCAYINPPFPSTRSRASGLRRDPYSISGTAQFYFSKRRPNTSRPRKRSATADPSQGFRYRESLHTPLIRWGCIKSKRGYIISRQNAFVQARQRTQSKPLSKVCTGPTGAHHLAPPFATYPLLRLHPRTRTPLISCQFDVAFSGCPLPSSAPLSSRNIAAGDPSLVRFAVRLASESRIDVDTRLAAHLLKPVFLPVSATLGEKNFHHIEAVTGRSAHQLARLSPAL